MCAHASPLIAKTLRHCPYGQLVGDDVVQLLPRERRGNLGTCSRSHRPRTEDRLVRCVLVEVDEDPRTSLLFPPSRGDQVGTSALELACHRHGGGTYLI